MEDWFTFPPEQPKKLTKYLKQKFEKHWTLGKEEEWTLRDVRQMKSVLQWSQLTALREFPAHNTEGEPRQRQET